MKEQILAVQRMQDYIAQNLSSDMNLSDFARVSLYSPWYSYRLFRETLELTPCGVYPQAAALPGGRAAAGGKEPRDRRRL